MNENNIRKTIRISESLYNKLNILAKENNMSVNKIISNILNYYIDSFNVDEMNNRFVEVLNNLQIINKKIEKLDGKLNNQFDISKQIFLNSGFQKNRTEKDDDIYREYITMKYKK